MIFVTNYQDKNLAVLYIALRTIVFFFFSLSADQINRFRHPKLLALISLVLGNGLLLAFDSPTSRLLSACLLAASAHVQGDAVSAARELSTEGEAGGGAG